MKMRWTWWKLIDTVRMREIEMQEKIRFKEIEEKWEIEELQIQEKRKAVEMQMQLRMIECEIQQCRLSKEKDERVPLVLSSLQIYLMLQSTSGWFRNWHGLSDIFIIEIYNS